MKKIEMPEIIGLYKKCGLNGEKDYSIRTDINTGTLKNELNIGSMFSKNQKDSMPSNNTVLERRVSF